MEKEIKLVTRTETFNNLAVKELGTGKAVCVCRLQFKRCDKSSCANCPQNQKYKNCVSQMSDYDKLRLDTYVSEYYALYSRWPDQWMNHKRYVSYYVKFFFALLFGMTAFFLLMGMMVWLWG